MRKICFILLTVMLIMCSSCTKNEIKIYSVSTGNIVTLNIDAEEEPMIDTRSYYDQEAEKTACLFLLGMELNGSYSYSKKTRLGLIDYYKGVLSAQEDEMIFFGIGRNTGKLVSYMHSYSDKKYIWSEEKLNNKMTQEECLPIAQHYLEQYTDLFTLYSLYDSDVVDGKKQSPNTYTFYYVLRNNGIDCDKIRIKIRSDGELASFFQENALCKQYYDIAGTVNTDKLYQVSRDVVKKKIKEKADEYLIEPVSEPYFEYYPDGSSKIRIGYYIYVDENDRSPNCVLVVVPLDLCR